MNRRLLIISGVAAAVVVLFAAGIGVALVMARTSQSTTANSATPIVTSAATHKVRTITGVIRSINGQTLVISFHKKTTNVTVNASTTYTDFVGNGPASVSNLQTGQTIQVKGELDARTQDMLASRITIMPPLGKITAITAQALTVATTGGPGVTVNISNSTIVYVDLVPVPATWLAVGESIGYQGTSPASGSGTVSAARIWLFLPSVRGAITAINGNTLTLQPTNAQASPVTLSLSPNTVYVKAGKALRQGTPAPSNRQIIQVGSKVQIVHSPNGSAGGTSAVVVIVM
ncbi:MAG: DUF5666 domain-containing protein [Chloroflexota bacterium]|nr:DUF5666 domain-containing protein [Chloroflexota bacterium]